MGPDPVREVTGAQTHGGGRRDVRTQGGDSPLQPSGEALEGTKPDSTLVSDFWLPDCEK